MAAFRSGLHSLLPDNVKLLSGPGCPVCVTPQQDIDLLLDLALRPNVTLCTYGDMLRVPSRTSSLERARAGGADVRVIYSTLDAVALARKSPEREVVLAAVGFETTAPATAAAVLAAHTLGLQNFSIFASHKRVVPALMALLQDRDLHVDGFLLPGHVSAIIGVAAYQSVVEHHHIPCVVSGFEDTHMAAAITRLVELIGDNKASLVNDYPEAVNPQGNATALALLDRVFEPSHAVWRALGSIPGSGFALRSPYRQYDAVQRFSLTAPEEREIPGCLCGKVIVGAATPVQCRLFGRACTPVNPIGPCMVSSEGTCQAWFKYARAGVSGRWTGSFSSDPALTQLVVHAKGAAL